MPQFFCCWKRVPFALAACFCILATVSCAHSRPPLTTSESEAWRGIDTAHTQEEAATSRKDIDGVMAVISPDCIGTLPDGRTVSYDQARQTTIGLFQMASDMKEKNVIQDISLKEDTAIVTVKVHSEITLRNPLTGQMMTKKQDDLGRETWVKSAQRWLLKSTAILKSSS